MKHSSSFEREAHLDAHPFKRVQIYFFLLIRQNVRLLFRMTIELKKLIRARLTTKKLCFAKYR